METDKERNKRLWEKCPTAEDLILERSKVDSLNENIVRTLISESQEAIRSKDVAKLFSMLAPDFVMDTVCLDENKNKIRQKQTRLEYESITSSWLYSCETSKYCMNVESIEIHSSEKASAIISLEDPANPCLEELHGPNVKEHIIIILFKGVPVVKSAYTENNNA